MIYRLRHETHYRYAHSVSQAAHLAHLLPQNGRFQRVIASDLRLAPQPGHADSARDCFGNMTSWIFIDTPHTEFTAVLEAEVEVTGQQVAPARDVAAWEEVAALAARGSGAAADAVEFLYPSPMLSPFAGARDYAAASFPPGRNLLDATIELTKRMQRDFAFRAGSTEVGTPLTQVFAQKSGVCQDFSHLMITALRGLGLPARYASGYIRTRPAPGRARRRGADQSHAWVSVWLGAQAGWVDVDPTNGIVVADEHVLLGYGRDFSDVSPLSGIILGGGAHSVSVSVDLEDAADAA